MTTPVWLPEMISVDGTWEDIITRLYKVFDRDFNKGNPHLKGIPVWWDRRMTDGSIYEEGFWHLISRNDERTGDRLLDPRRAERLPWCKPTIEHTDDSAVKLWDSLEGRHKRTYVWLEHHDYVIVLKKRRQRIGEVAFLITAYHVDGPKRRESLRRKYNERIS